MRPAETANSPADGVTSGGESIEDENISANGNAYGDSDPESPGATTYDVHGGMLRMARVMGEKGKPVHTAVRDALRKNRGYGLFLFIVLYFWSGTNRDIGRACALRS